MASCYLYLRASGVTASSSERSTSKFRMPPRRFATTSHGEFTSNNPLAEITGFVDHRLESLEL
ncbi:hypothetical protein BDV98DRAFT_50107 [Pterulicium gracile]|uniref:Uncharacterized protein n=1 Tax=Pterulicium gracile TaxID=1884261 RepID=A0A5C3QLP9_9AGAR|nr:hypothetical protein BDV98DRAFT_50107 [Pterula gracilis]